MPALPEAWLLEPVRGAVRAAVVEVPGGAALGSVVVLGDGRGDGVTCTGTVGEGTTVGEAVGEGLGGLTGREADGVGSGGLGEGDVAGLGDGDGLAAGDGLGEGAGPPAGAGSSWTGDPTTAQGPLASEIWATSRVQELSAPLGLASQAAWSTAEAPLEGWPLMGARARSHTGPPIPWSAAGWGQLLLVQLEVSSISTTPPLGQATTAPAAAMPA
jgi:hypothetical protein